MCLLWSWCIAGVLMTMFKAGGRVFAKEDQNCSQIDFCPFANMKKSIYCFDLGLHVAVEIVFCPELSCKGQWVKMADLRESRAGKKRVRILLQTCMLKIAAHCYAYWVVCGFFLLFLKCWYSGVFSLLFLNSKHFQAEEKCEVRRCYFRSMPGLTSWQ